MSPFKIKIMLHYCAIVTDYDGPEVQTAIDGAICEFVDAGLLEKSQDGVTRRFDITEKGMAYVAAIVAIPIPVCVWTIPE